MEQIIHAAVTKAADPALQVAAKLFMDLPEIENFLTKRPFVSEFKRHLLTYISLYLPDCPFQIETTDRYSFRSGRENEGAIVARAPILPDERVKYLLGYLVGVTEEELEDTNDFSVINLSTRGGLPSLMLGPLRFVNHDCNPNARFVASGSSLSVITTRHILLGEEITVKYSDDYFGPSNCDCLCATCEREKKGFYKVPDDELWGSSGPDSGSEEPLESGVSGKVLQVIELNSDEDSDLEMIIPQETKKTVPPRRRRARRSTAISKEKLMNQTIFDFHQQIDSSPDEFSVKVKNPEFELELKQRRIHRSLHRLYCKKYYERNMSDVYDCRNCGVYFDARSSPHAQHPNLYCPRCVRHDLMYELPWPNTGGCEIAALDHVSLDRLSVGKLRDQLARARSRSMTPADMSVKIWLQELDGFHSVPCIRLRSVYQPGCKQKRPSDKKSVKSRMRISSDKIASERKIASTEIASQKASDKQIALKKKMASEKIASQKEIAPQKTVALDKKTHNKTHKRAHNKTLERHEKRPLEKDIHQNKKTHIRTLRSASPIGRKSNPVDVIDLTEDEPILPMNNFETKDLLDKQLKPFNLPGPVVVESDDDMDDMERKFGSKRIMNSKDFNKPMSSKQKLKFLKLQSLKNVLIPVDLFQKGHRRKKTRA